MQSFFVRGTEVGAPKLQQVIVSYQSSNGTEIAVGPTLRGALVKIFGDAVPQGIEDTEVVVEPGDGNPDPGDGGTTTTTTPSGDPSSVAARRARLVADLVDAFDTADAAARRGDLVAREEALKEAERLGRELAQLDGSAGGSGSGSGSSSTTSTTTSSSSSSTSSTTTTTTTTAAPP